MDSKTKLASWTARYGTRGLQLLVHRYMVETFPYQKPPLEREIRTALDGLVEALEEVGNGTQSNAKTE